MRYKQKQTKKRMKLNCELRGKKRENKKKKKKEKKPPVIVKTDVQGESEG